MSLQSLREMLAHAVGQAETILEETISPSTAMVMFIVFVVAIIVAGMALL